MDDDTVVTMTQEAFETAARRALADLGLTYRELAEQAQRREFSSERAHLLWVSIGGTVNEETL